MIELKRLEVYLEGYLNISNIKDYCPNGLQVQGKDKVKRIVSGVTACQALLDKAMVLKADAVLVHHGYFWKGEDQCVVGMKKNRLKTLIENDVSLLAYHLPLDVHRKVGNNVQLANQLGLRVIGDIPYEGLSNLGLVAELDQAASLEDFTSLVDKKLVRKPLTIKGGDHPVKRIGICTGGAQNLISAAFDQDVDVFLTGEVSEQTVHFAREQGIHFIAAGHHATERYGVQALGSHLAAEFKVEHQFLDIDNPA